MNTFCRMAFCLLIFVSCQPYGTPAQTPTCIPPQTIDEILAEQEPFVVDVFVLFKKINTDRLNQYKEELLKIADSLRDTPVEKANIDTLKALSPLFQSRSSLTEADYGLLLTVVIQLAQGTSTEDALQKGIDLYIYSSFRRPNGCLSSVFF